MGQVLIVDDDQEIRALVCLTLEEKGYRVTEATSAVAALDLLRSSQERFVVLLDYLRPNGDGKQVLQVVSQDAGLSSRHVYVLLTAHTGLPLSVLVLANTLYIPVVRKPFERKLLLATVAQALSRLEAG